MVSGWQRQTRLRGAGRLKHRVAFDKRAFQSDGYGNSQGDWSEQFVVAAGIEARLGGEEVMAARLANRQPVTIIVRQSPDTKLISTDWRARDVRDGTVYAIRSKVDVEDTGKFFDILCETSVAP